METKEELKKQIEEIDAQQEEINAQSQALWNRGSEIQEQREKVVKEVLDTVEHIGKTVESFHSFTTERNETNLDKLRGELDQTIAAAKRTEVQIASLDGPSYDPSEFLKEE